MKRSTILAFTTLTISQTAAAHGGHWHLDEETLEKIFAAADALYAWFASHTVAMAAGLGLALLIWLPLWFRNRRSARGT